VCDADGGVRRDEQRDRVYTYRLGEALVRAYPKGTTIMSTHLVAWVAWRLLEEKIGSTDPYRLVRVPEGSRRFDRAAFVERLGKAKDAVMRGALLGRWDDGTPATADDLLAQALDRFNRYHRSHAVRMDGGDVFLEDAKLCLYYRNRLDNPSLLAGERDLHGGS
jgi:glycerol-3-phosphate O-acyltransferase